MRLQRFTLGEVMVNTYLFWEEGTREAIVIDPGRPVEPILSALKENNLKLVGIILTHGHYDHILGVSDLKSKINAPVYAHSGDAAMLANPVLNLSQLFAEEIILKPDRLLAEGDAINVGSFMLTVRHTPGHTPGGICLFGEDLLFSGDTLFARSIGRTDLPGGDQGTLLHSVRSLLSLSDQTRVFPGHGPETRIGIERAVNPFLQENQKEN
jgi:glyoxylase-like metal-dependent hydrolase (beta-lactamase superfamily II)